jgi:hypothetical protein
MTNSDALTFAIQKAFALFRMSKLKTSVLSDLRRPLSLPDSLQCTAPNERATRSALRLVSSDARAVPVDCLLAASAQSKFTANSEQAGAPAPPRLRCATINTNQLNITQIRASPREPVIISINRFNKTEIHGRCNCQHQSTQQKSNSRASQSCGLRSRSRDAERRVSAPC